MSDKITTLHLKNDPSTNIYPNVKIENIPLDERITRDGENLVKTKTIYDFTNANFLSLDGGTMDGIITINDIGIPEKTILGDGVEVVEVSNPAQPVTHYGSGYIRQDDDENTSIKYEYNFPKKSGTFALGEELEELKSLVYSLHSLTYNAYEFTNLTTSAIPDEVDGRKVVSGSHAIADWVGGNSFVYNQLVDKDEGSTETINGVTFTKNGDGSWLANGTATADVVKRIATIIIPKNHRYLMKGCARGGSFSTYYLRNDNRPQEARADIGNGVIDTWDYAFNWALQVVIKSGTTLNNLVFRPQVFDLTLSNIDSVTTVEEAKAELLKRGVDVDEYNEFNAGEIKSTIVSKIESYSTEGVKLGEINIPNAPLKLDGVNDVHNLLTFEEQSDGTYNAILTRKFIIYDMGTMGWTLIGTSKFQIQLGSEAKGASSNSEKANILCERYQIGSWSQVYANENKVLGLDTSRYLAVTDTDYTDVASFKSAMSGVKLYCERTTPTTEVIATGLSFDDTIFKIEKGGSIKAIYEEVPPTISVNFMTKSE